MIYGDDDWQNEHIVRLDREVASLQNRLNEYHAWLEECLEHDREFQMKATWGILNGLVGMVAYGGTFYISQNWLHLTGWVMQVLSGVVAFCAYIAAVAWSDRGREGDLKKLSRLPKWDAET